MGNWAETPMDVATKISEHIQHHEDFECFGNVCSRWRSAAKEATFRATINPSIYLLHDHGRHSVPWLMLPDHHDSPAHRTFHSLCHRKLCRVSLHSTYLLSSRSWLLCFSGIDLNLSLFNPFSGSFIQLPIVPPLHPTYTPQAICYDKFILSADPATTSNYAVAVIFSHPYADLRCPEYRVAIWWNGDTNWVRVGDRIIYRAFQHFCHDLAFYKGEFYAVDGFGQVLCLGTSKGRPFRGKGIPQSLANIPVRVDDDSDDHSMFYLVECEGDDKLLVIYRGIRVHYIVKYEEGVDPLDGSKFMYEVTSKDDKEVRTYIFRAFEVDVETGEVEKVHSLGNRAVFLGLNSSFSIEAAPNHGSKPNCIYFTDGYMSIYNPRYVNKGQDVGIYNFTNGTFEDYHYDGFSSLADFATPPIWVQPPSI